MLINIIRGIDKMNKNNHFSITTKYGHDLLKEKANVNIHRTKIISNIVIAVNLALIYVDISRFSTLWNTIPSYKNLFYSHLLITSFLLIYRYILYVEDQSANKKILSNTKSTQLLYLVFMAILLLWCVFLAINAQGIHGQISAYIIVIFCLASSLILNPIESAVIYTGILLIFILGLFSLSISSQEVSGHIINASFLTFLAFGVSTINYEAYANNFINKKIIFEKNQELNNSHIQLKNAVNLRTEQLTNANQELIKEISLRHHAEMEAIKGKLLYEEKAKLLDKAKEYESLRNTFFANISHELRTPLNVILSAQHMVGCVIKDHSDKEDKEKKLFHYTKIIKQNSYRLIRLLSNLIDITKIDAGSFDLHLENYDIIKVIENITLSVVPFVEAKNINIIFDTEVEEKIIACDPDKMERIMLNLVSNAIKFTPKGGYIYVNIYDATDTITISVKDTGIGIPTSMQEKVFERFVQVEHTTKRNQEGSGIGLSLVKLIVEMHKGSIMLNSIEGEGSEFIIKIPVITLTDNNTIINDSNNNDIENTKIEKINIEFSDIYT